jgi:hypothetical protein
LKTNAASLGPWGIMMGWLAVSDIFAGECFWGCGRILRSHTPHLRRTDAAPELDAKG